MTDFLKMATENARAEFARRPLDELFPESEDEKRERLQRERNTQIVNAEIQAWLDRRESGQ